MNDKPTVNDKPGPTAIQNGPIILTVFIILLFGARVLEMPTILVHLAGLSEPPPNPSIDQLLYAAVTLVLGFWFGSSRSGMVKDETIKQMGLTLVPAPDAASAPLERQQTPAVGPANAAAGTQR